MTPSTEDEMTQYLVEIEWKAPIATSVREVLDAFSSNIEQTTREVPTSMSHGFVVVSAGDRQVVEDFAWALRAAGAHVTIVDGAS
jgi:hypothetical protein